MLPKRSLAKHLLSSPLQNTTQAFGHETLPESSIATHSVNTARNAPLVFCCKMLPLHSISLMLPECFITKRFQSAPSQNASQVLSQETLPDHSLAKRSPRLSHETLPKRSLVKCSPSATKALGLSCVTPEMHEKMECDTVHDRLSCVFTKRSLAKRP